MSELNANYTFLSYLRQGIAAAIARPATDASRAEVPVTLVFNEKQARLEATAGLAMFGPGDITGLDPRVVIRTSPPVGALDARSNSFPFVEFDQPDLPWRYTPDAADDKGRLTPWLCLIVLAEGEYKPGSPAAPERLPFIEVEPGVPLPNLKQAWAWAHVQVSGMENADSESCARVLASQPERMLARLVCPRRLLERQSYAAFVVPVYERGRLAGLGEEVKGSATRLAWDVESPREKVLKLPFYFEWHFGTGGKGDFEYLVTRLQARPLPSSVGQRSLDVSHPGAGLPAASSKPMDLEASLGSPSMGGTPWSGAEKESFVKELQKLVNQPEAALENEAAERKVAPPLYGRWHAACKKLALRGEPAWFHQLNADPRLRVAAAMGTRVVQQQQEQLMASAWRQVEGIEVINAELKQAQAARESAGCIYRRDLLPASQDELLLLTAPMHSQVARGEIAQALKQSPIPDGVFESQFRRVSRRYGRIGWRQGRPGNAPSRDMLARMNQGELAADRPPATPDKLLTLHGALPAENIESLKNALGCHWFPGQPVPGAGDDRAFELAACDLLDVFAKEPAAAPPRRKTNLDEIRKQIIAELDTGKTIPASYRHRLRFKGTWDAADPLEQIMAAPEFPQPMYKPLADLSQDWVLPGLDQVLPNTLTLASSNQPFIEAYMVGLNHEMAGELLWRSTPPTSAAPIFASSGIQAGMSVEMASPLRMRCLRILNLSIAGQKQPHWAHTGQGTQTPATFWSSWCGENCSSAIQIRWYMPSRLWSRLPDPIYTSWGPPNVTRCSAACLNQMWPFLDFNLTRDSVRGSDTDPGWFFVLQEQPSEPDFGLDAADGPMGEQKVESWDKLSWGHLAGNPADWDKLAYIDLDSTLPDTTKAEQNVKKVAWHTKEQQDGTAANAAALAYITLQKPVRIAIHGSDMLPPE